MRELETCLASAIALAGGASSSVEHLPAAVRRGRAATTAPIPRSTRQELRARLVDLLREHRGNVSAVARAMGKARMQIHRWMKRFGLEPDAYRAEK